MILRQGRAAEVAVSELSDADIAEVKAANLDGLDATLRCESSSLAYISFWRHHGRAWESLTWLLEPLGLPSYAHREFFDEVPSIGSYPSFMNPDGSTMEIEGVRRVVAGLRAEYEEMFEPMLREYLASRDGIPREYVLASLAVPGDWIDGLEVSDG